MLVTGIDMGLSSHDDDAVEVMNVDMNEYPEQSAQDLLADLKEVLWKGNTCEQRREDNCFLKGSSEDSDIGANLAKHVHLEP